MSEQGYNGWTNYETWVTKLWIDNEQGTQEYWLEEAKTLDFDPYKLAEALKESHEETADEYVFDASRKGLIAEASVFSDLMTHALGCVNWDEIAKSIVEDAKELSE